jgi:nucleotide-binding universal stress UspA family protein
MSGPGASRSTSYRRILWPTDFSALAKAALPYAVDLAADSAAELVLLHVLTPPVAYAGPEIPGALWGELQQKNRVAAREELRRLAAQVKRPKVRVHTVLAEGVPFDQILKVAKRLRCDLIVVATHGRTGLAHVVMGSVAENVVRRATCPVLTVRPPRIKP